MCARALIFIIIKYRINGEGHFTGHVLSDTMAPITGVAVIPATAGAAAAAAEGHILMNKRTKEIKRILFRNLHLVYL